MYKSQTSHLLISVCEITAPATSVPFCISLHISSLVFPYYATTSANSSVTVVVLYYSSRSGSLSLGVGMIRPLPGYPESWCTDRREMAAVLQSALESLVINEWSYSCARMPGSVSSTSVFTSHLTLLEWAADKMSFPTWFLFF